MAVLTSRWPLSVRLAAVVTAIVALGSAVLSWDALSWGAAQLGVDSRLTWLYPVVIDGVILVGTIAALALRRERFRRRLYVWTLLGGAILASVVGNGAHAAAGSWLHVVGSAVPAVALAASLHLLVILVRHAVPGTDMVPVMSAPVDVEDIEPVRDLSPRPRVPARVHVEQLVRRHGQDISADVVAARVGVSRRHAGRLLRELRRPHIVEEGS